MVFLIQNAQNRDSQSIHVKLDEIIRALDGAHNTLLDLDEIDDETLEKMRARYSELGKRARKLLEEGGDEVGCEEIELVQAYRECAEAGAGAMAESAAKAIAGSEHPQ